MRPHLTILASSLALLAVSTVSRAQQPELELRRALYEAGRLSARFESYADTSAEVHPIGVVRVSVWPRVLLPGDPLRVHVVVENTTGANIAFGHSPCPVRLAIAAQVTPATDLAVACREAPDRLVGGGSVTMDYQGSLVAAEPGNVVVTVTVAMPHVAKESLTTTLTVARLEQSTVLGWDRDSAGVMRPVLPYLIQFAGSRVSFDTMAVHRAVARIALERGVIPRALTPGALGGDSTHLYLGLDVFAIDSSHTRFVAHWYRDPRQPRCGHTGGGTSTTADTLERQATAFMRRELLHFPVRICVAANSANGIAAAGVAGPTVLRRWTETHQADGSVKVKVDSTESGKGRANVPSDSAQPAVVIRVTPAEAHARDTVIIHGAWRNFTDGVVRFADSRVDVGWVGGGACPMGLDVASFGTFLTPEADPCAGMERAVVPRDSNSVDRRVVVTMTPGDYPVFLDWTTEDGRRTRATVVLHVAPSLRPQP